MHTNHRRKNRFRAKHHNRVPNVRRIPWDRKRWWHPPLSIKDDRRRKSRQRRVEERRLMARQAYDDLPAKEHKTLHWWWYEWLYF